MGTKPTTFEEYTAWLKDTHSVVISDRTKAHYEAVAAKIKSDFENSSFWNALTSRLVDFDAEYRLRDNYPLLMTSTAPDVVVKPYGSFIRKTFRRNCIDNAAWPAAPAQGWYLPDSWFSLTKDIVRTSLVVKYLDGVAFLGERIDDLAQEHDVRDELSYEARMEGYYAGHVVTRHDVSIPKQNWDTTPIRGAVEIQITTQLQEVIRKLLHRYYEDRRLDSGGRQHDWQWDFKSDEFVANNLGHILHYVEGMIMEVRERQNNKEEVVHD